MRQPPPLQQGDRLSIVAPSGPIRDWQKFHQGLDIWRRGGYELDIPTDIDASWGYLAGTDSHRCHQWQKAWTDPDTKAIVCARGGYGAMRLLETLGDQFFPWEQSAKWLIGFSDITALLWAVSHAQHIITLHAPVLTTLADEPLASIDHLFNLLENPHYKWQLQGRGWGGGQVQGRLWAGNLTVATSLMGTPCLPNLEGAILALEDIYEVPYRLDRLLTQWRCSGQLWHIKGIALGRFSETETDLPSLTLAEMFLDRLQDLGIPIVSDLPFGHGGCNMALPVGQMVCLDGDRGLLGAV
jgi:muramoyltetrapeptide carboxypeptidase